MAASHSWATALAMDSALPFDTSSEAFEFISATLKETVERIDNEGLRGTRSRRGERVVPGLKRILGDIVMNPAPDELDRLLPRILGAAESTDVFAVAETLPEFFVMIDKVAKLQTYSNCRVARATFRGQAGQPVVLTLSVVGKSRTEGAAGGFPAVTYTTQEPYVFHQGVLTLHAAAREIEEFELTIDNVIEPRFRNSQTATDVTPADRIVTLSCRCPYDATNADVYTNESGGTFASGTLVLTNGARSLQFALNALKSIPETPEVPGRGQELMLPLNYRAHMTGTTREIVVTNDNTV
jgi:hypothetical protein